MTASVEGADTFASTLEAAAEELTTLTDGHKAAAQILMQKSASLVPRRSGALAASGKVVMDTDGFRVTWGSASVPYAGVINFGWPARGIRAQPFATDPLDRSRADLERAYHAAAVDAVETIHA